MGHSEDTRNPRDTFTRFVFKWATAVAFTNRRDPFQTHHDGDIAKDPMNETVGKCKVKLFSSIGSEPIPLFHR